VDVRGGDPEHLAPSQTCKYEKTPWPRWLVHTRRRIDPVLAQLVARYRS
jgi:hypothetical protein